MTSHCLVIPFVGLLDNSRAIEFQYSIAPTTLENESVPITE